VANENRLPVSREFAPRDRDASTSMRDVEETIILRVEISTRNEAKSAEYIHNPCHGSGPKKDRHGLPRPYRRSGFQWRRQQELGPSSRPQTNSVQCGEELTFLYFQVSDDDIRLFHDTEANALQCN
jgi:hypothetical protein